MLKSNHINIFSKTPCAALRPFVRRFLVVESTVAHADMHLPETGFVAAFRSQGDCQLAGGIQAPPAAISGLWDSARSHCHSQDHVVVIASFTTTGAFALLPPPLDELANTTTDLAAILRRPAALNQLHEQLAMATNHQQRILLVETFLCQRIDSARLDPEVSTAVQLIARAQAPLRIEELAQQLGLSQSALERRFRRVVGAPPRHFASLVRLQNVVRLQATGADLTTIAHAAGYFDQAHFIKDFKRFSGVAPGPFFADTSAI